MFKYNNWQLSKKTHHQNRDSSAIFTLIHCCMQYYRQDFTISRQPLEKQKFLLQSAVPRSSLEKYAGKLQPNQIPQTNIKNSFPLPHSIQRNASGRQSYTKTQLYLHCCLHKLSNGITFKSIPLIHSCEVIIAACVMNMFSLETDCVISFSL